MKEKKIPFPIYICESKKEQLKKEAESKSLSLNAYINMILAERKK